MKLKTRISLSNFRNKQSVEKNITNLNLYKSNLNKVDKALRINHPRGSITHNNANVSFYRNWIEKNVMIWSQTILSKSLLLAIANWKQIFHIKID